MASSRDRFRAIASRARSAIVSNSTLLLNSGAMTLGSAFAAVLGFAFWWVAARFFAPEAVGVSSALISLMGLLALLGEVGLGTLLIGEPLRRQGRDQGLLTAALLTALAAAGGFGLAYVASTALWPSLSRGFGMSAFGDALFIAGCALTGIALVGDQALVGLLRGDLQLVRNAAFSVIKLLLLAVGAVVHGLDDASTILLAWVAGLGLSLTLAGVLAKRRSVVAFRRPDFPALLPKVARVADHHALNMAAQAPTIVFPFVVAVLFSPIVNAAFYPAWAIVHTATLFPAALTTVLYRVAGEDADGGARRLGFSLVLSSLFSVAAGLGLFLFSREILAFFNPSYPDIAGPSLGLLGFGIVSLAIRCHHMALMRIRGLMRRASVQYAAWSGLEIGSACVGGHLAGLEGFTIGWLLAMSAQAASMLVPLLSAAGLPRPAGWAAGRVRKPVLPRPGATPVREPLGCRPEQAAR